MLRAIIFDFNGVIIDDEPLHFVAFRDTLAEEGMSMTEPEYYEGYLGIDDRTFFTRAYANKGRGVIEGEQLAAIIDRKGDAYLEQLDGKLRIFEGVEALAKAAGEHYPVAITSGARRREIEAVLEKAQLGHLFCEVVSADDMEKGKPDPEGYLRTYRLLCEKQTGCADLKPSECLVLEDSPAGIVAAHAAGMPCVAVATSRPASALTEAELVVTRLTELTVTDLEQLVARHNG